MVSSSAVLIVLGGLPGTGKSTVARAYVAAAGASYLRVDTIEQTLINSTDLRPPLGPVGYELGYALAAGMLRAGTRQVVVECVNPLGVTREAWRNAGAAGGAVVIEVEVVCSDPVEHRHRIESRGADIPGLRLPTWRDVQDRAYEAWDRTSLTLDTARCSPAECAALLHDAVEHAVDQRATRIGVHQVDLADWRWLLGALRGRVETGAFEVGADFVAAVGRLAPAVGRHLNVDVRAGHVQVVVRSPDVDGVTERDVRLAEQISALAAERGLVPRPERVQVLELALDTPVPGAVLPFWAAVLAGTSGSDDVVDPAGEFPPLWFQETDSTAPDRQRFHLDVTVPPEVANQRIAAAIAAGGKVVDATSAPAFVVLADADGNKVCICTALGRE